MSGLGIGIPKKKFSWSYSKLKNFLTCAYRYKAIDVDKRYKEDFSGEALAWGKQVHTAFEERIRDGKPFPVGMEYFEPAALRLLAVPGKIMVEQQLCIKADLSPTAWNDWTNGWFRAIADYLAISDKVALAIDYKTGKVIEDPIQLSLLGECIFAHYPEVQAVRCEYWWLKDDAVTREVYYRTRRQDTWKKVFPDLIKLRTAHDTGAFPPTPGGLCKKWCIVKDCPHHGKG